MTMHLSIDPIAAASLEANRCSVDHVIAHHREHLASGCQCLFGRDGCTGMKGPDGVVLIISEPLGRPYLAPERRR